MGETVRVFDTACSLMTPVAGLPGVVVITGRVV
jgi:hypothetical protein